MAWHWQVTLGGVWKDVSPEDGRLLDEKYQAGQTRFQIVSRGQLYDIDLEGGTWVQKNAKTGRGRQLRIWPPPDDCSPTSAANGPLPHSFSALSPSLARCATSVAMGMPQGPLDGARFFVWRSNDWHPVAAAQEEQIRAKLAEGLQVFEVRDSPYTWRIDTTGKEGWVQISAAGRRRSMKYQEAPEAGAGDTVSTRPSRRPCGSGPLLEALLEEWRVMSGGKDHMTMNGMEKAWSQTFGSTMHDRDKELLAQSAADAFLKVNLNRNSRIDLQQWVHYRLLENQAPSFHALAQVNEELLEWLGYDAGILKRLLDLFRDSLEGEGRQDARLTAGQMRGAVRRWLDGFPSPPRVSMSKHFRDRGSSIEYLRDLLEDKHAFAEDESVTYYDFMNHMLGRRKVSVQLHQYDLTDGKAWWLTPILLCQRFEGIWHTGVVVHDKEYWFGGKIFESTPGQTPFGQPTKVIELDQTMRTAADLRSFIRKELCDEFTTDTYDVLLHNCNHFSDAACMFLLNQHIPEDVLKQPDLLMKTLTVQLLRPFLNRMLGRFDSDGSSGSSEARGCLTDVVRDQQDDWDEVTWGTLVVYEYEAGWTCIARVTAREELSCDLQWLDVREGILRTTRGVERQAVEVLRGEDEKKCHKRRGGGGIFSACLHPT